MVLMILMIPALVLRPFLANFFPKGNVGSRVVSAAVETGIGIISICLFLFMKRWQYPFYILTFMSVLIFGKPAAFEHMLTPIFGIAASALVAVILHFAFSWAFVQAFFIILEAILLILGIWNLIGGLKTEIS